MIDDQKPAELRSFRSRNRSASSGGIAHRRQQLGARPLQVRAGIRHRVPESIIRPRYDKAFVVGFDVTPEVTQDFTDSTEQLRAGVRMLRPGGGTAMYDALYYACRDKI